MESISNDIKFSDENLKVPISKWVWDFARAKTKEDSLIEKIRNFIDFVKMSIQKKIEETIDFTKVVMEYCKLCAQERIEKGTIGKIYSEFMSLMQKHNKRKINEEKDTHEDKGKGVEI